MFASGPVPFPQQLFAVAFSSFISSKHKSLMFAVPSQPGSPCLLEKRKSDHPAKEVCTENNPKQTGGIILKNLEGKKVETANTIYL